MNNDIRAFNALQSRSDKAICNALAKEIDAVLTDAESRLWHAHPVWFLEGNPIVGYSKLIRACKSRQPLPGILNHYS